MKSSTLFGILFFVILVGLVFCGISVWSGRSPSIDSVWIINLDRDTKRWEHIQSQAKAIELPVERWSATYGKTEERRVARQEGVDMFLMVSEDEAENKRTTTILQKPGVIGCWLSHKRLLRHLATLPVSPSFGHLILEDDVDIPVDFKKQWASLCTQIPRHWDVVYLGVGKPTGSLVSEGVLKAGKQEDSGNTGTYAYLVRHGAIPAILKKLEFMSSPIDKQYYKTFTDLQVYILEPSLITPGTFDSSILAQ